MSRPAPPLSRSESVRKRLAERKVAHKREVKKLASKRSLLGQLRESASTDPNASTMGDSDSKQSDINTSSGSSGAGRGTPLGQQVGISPKPPQASQNGRPSPRTQKTSSRAVGGSKLAPRVKESPKSGSGSLGHRIAIVDHDVASTAWKEALASRGSDGKHHSADDDKGQLQRELERQLSLGLTTVDREFRRQADALDASLQRNKASRRAKHEAKQRLADYQKQLEEVEARARRRVAKEFAASGSGRQPSGSENGAAHDTHASIDTTVGTQLEEEDPGDEVSASVSSKPRPGPRAGGGGFTPRLGSGGPMSPSILDRTRSRAGSVLSETAQSVISEKTKTNVQPDLEARRLKATYQAGLAVTEHAHEQEALKQRLSLEERLKRRNLRRARRREQAERRRRQKEQEAAGVMRSSIAGSRGETRAGQLPDRNRTPSPIRLKSDSSGAAAAGAGSDSKPSATGATVASSMPSVSSFSNGGGQEIPQLPSELDVMTRGRSDSVLRRGYQASARARTIEDIMQGKLTSEEQASRTARMQEHHRRLQLHQTNMELQTLAGASAALARVSVQLSKLRHRRDDVRKENPTKRNPAPCPVFEIANRAAMAEDRAERDALNQLAQKGIDKEEKERSSSVERRSGASAATAISASTGMRATSVSHVVTRDRVESMATENRPMEDLMSRLKQERGRANSIARSASESLAAHKEARRKGREAALEVIRTAEEEGQGLVEGSHPAVVLSLERHIQLLVARVDAAEAAVDAAEMVQAQLFEKDSDQGTEWSDEDDDIDLVMATVQLAEEEVGISGGRSGGLGFGDGDVAANGGDGDDDGSSKASGGSGGGGQLSTGGLSGSGGLARTRSIEKMTGLAGAGALDRALQQEFMASVPPAVDAVARAEVLYGRLQHRIELLRTAQTMSLCRRRLVTQFQRYDRLKEAGATAVTALNTAARSVTTAEMPERELARAVLEAQQEAELEAEYKAEKAVVQAERTQHNAVHLGAPPPGESPVGLGDDASRASITPAVTSHEKDALARLKQALDRALEDVFEAEEAVTAHTEEVESRRAELFLELQRLKSDAETAEEKINRAARDTERATHAFEEAVKSGLLQAVGRAAAAKSGGSRSRAMSDAPDRGKIREALATPDKWRERVAQAQKDIAEARRARAAAAEAHFVAVLAAEGRRPGAAAAAAHALERNGGGGAGHGFGKAGGMALSGPRSSSPPRRRRGRRASVIAFVPMTERKNRMQEYQESVAHLRKLSEGCEQWSKASAEVLKMLREGARSKAQSMRSTEQGAVVRLEQCESRLDMVREEVEADAFDVFQPGTAAAGRMEAAMEIATEAVRSAKRARTKVRRPGMGKKQRAKKQEQELRRRLEQSRSKDRFGLRAGLTAGLADRSASSSGKLDAKTGGGTASSPSGSLQAKAGTRRGLQPPPSAAGGGALKASDETGGLEGGGNASGAGSDDGQGKLDPAVEAALASSAGGLLAGLEDSDSDASEGGSSDDDDDFDPVAAALKKRRLSKRRASQAAKGRRRSIAMDAADAARSKGGSDMEAAAAAAKALQRDGLTEAERKELEADLVEVDGEDPISTKGLNAFVLAVATAVAQVSDAAALRRQILEDSRKRRRLRNATNAAKRGGGIAGTASFDAANASARFAALIDVQRSELPRIEYAKGHRSLAVALVDPPMSSGVGRGGHGGLSGGSGAVPGGWSRSIDALVESRLLIEGAGSTLVGADGRPRGLVPGKVDAYVQEQKAGGQLGLRRDFLEVLARLKAVTLRYNSQLDLVRTSGLTVVKGAAGRRMLDAIQLANASLGAADAMLPAPSEMVKLRVSPKRVSALEAMTRKSGIRVVRFEVVFNETIMDRDSAAKKAMERAEMLEREKQLAIRRRDEAKKRAEEEKRRQEREVRETLSRSGTAAEADMAAASATALAQMKRAREERHRKEQQLIDARRKQLDKEEAAMEQRAAAEAQRQQLRVQKPPSQGSGSTGTAGRATGSSPLRQGGAPKHQWPVLSPMGPQGSGPHVSLDPSTASPRDGGRVRQRPAQYAGSMGSGSIEAGSTRGGSKGNPAFSFGSQAVRQGEGEPAPYGMSGPTMSPLVSGGMASFGSQSRMTMMPQPRGLQHTQSFIDPRTGQQIVYVQQQQPQPQYVMVPTTSPMGSPQMVVGSPQMVMTQPGMVPVQGGMVPGQGAAQRRWRSLRHVMSAAGAAGMRAGMAGGGMSGVMQSPMGRSSGVAGPGPSSPRMVMQHEQRSVASGYSGQSSPRSGRPVHGTAARGSPRGGRRTGGTGGGMEVAGYIGGRDDGGKARRGVRGSGGDGDRRSRLAASAQRLVQGGSPRKGKVPSSPRQARGEKQARTKRGR